ncbi:MAG: hypothetical protein HZA46_14730 [Planctomycetales bacterium]|nr:hypothetical protein [Planctomycetales bacterium]
MSRTTEQVPDVAELVSVRTEVSRLRRRHRPLRELLAIAVASEVIYVVIAWLSRQFVFGVGFEQRPIVPILALFAVAFGLSLRATVVAARLRIGRAFWWAIIGPAILFRLTLLVSEPIQEIDIYRYQWDGAVLGEGVSPFRFTPAEVLAARDADELPADLARLVAVRDRSPALREILMRIHYGELPTVYPPVSQLVFAAVSRLTPTDATFSQRVLAMKLAIVLFDLATVAILCRLLLAARRHPGWSVAYAWCPLVMKEFANSGHLDSIAVCFATLSVLLAVQSGLRRDRNVATFARTCGLSKIAHVLANVATVWKLPLGIAAAVCLGLSVGAKLYAAVLGPWLLVVLARGMGWRRALLCGSVFFATSLLTLAPMIVLSPRKPTTAITPMQTEPLLPNEMPSPTPPPPDSLAGLKTFLRRWEMNDFAFLILLENLRVPDSTKASPTPWFAIAPDSWRQWLVTCVQSVSNGDATEAAFLLTRLLTLALFTSLAFVFARRAAMSDKPAVWLESAFLTLAWFWILSPTQNPWYWTWALPLLPFARARAWRIVSGVCFLYYLRFWLTYHWPEHSVLGTPYNGPQFFDFVVTWIEHAPWLLMLGIEFVRRGEPHATRRRIEKTSPDVG